jgi:hypothetical protein
MAGFVKLGDILKEVRSVSDKHITKEFQKYGYDLARQLDDMAHKSLYIKLAKEVPRAFLENAKEFVKDAGRVKSKARLFMWKLKELKSKSSKSTSKSE